MLIAAGEVGQRETRDGKTSNPRIVIYQSYTRLPEHLRRDETEWCAAFVCFSLDEGGCVNPRYAMARNFEHYGTRVKVPEFGDILIFGRGKDAKQGHVCFYVADLGADYEVLGGNQHNSVCFSHEHKGDLVAAVRPSVLAA